ncbi:PREDICTED: uncharacterized protein At5g39570 [Nelumbo nucifera]|uniref:Uncharacterized protein At5g39570 n=1 Tax=Nelumbo nucifera TaxID=4432 RepID=A0A1U8B9W6_NELNU|nr:PREDICTED: uncharacterized protein At5g39570 [Nelumbo nucifera]
MAYTSSEFNVPEFFVYNPNPYAGGYDITQTYGKSFPPSEAICYPRSSSGSISPPSDEKVEYTVEPHKGSGRRRPKGTSEEEQLHYGDNGNWLNGLYPWYDDNRDHIFSHGHGNEYDDNDYGSGFWKPVGSYQGKEQEDGYFGTGEMQPIYDHHPWSSYGNGYGYGGQENGYAYAEQESLSSYGYFLDGTGICADLFGNFPCLSRKDQKRYCQQDGEEQSYGDQWKGTAEYFFGTSNPYGEIRDQGITYGDLSQKYYYEYQEGRYDQ